MVEKPPPESAPEQEPQTLDAYLEKLIAGDPTHLDHRNRIRGTDLNSYTLPSVAGEIASYLNTQKMSMKTDMEAADEGKRKYLATKKQIEDITLGAAEICGALDMALQVIDIYEKMLARDRAIIMYHDDVRVKAFQSLQSSFKQRNGLSFQKEDLLLIDQTAELIAKLQKSLKQRTRGIEKGPVPEEQPAVQVPPTLENAASTPQPPKEHSALVNVVDRIRQKGKLKTEVKSNG